MTVFFNLGISLSNFELTFLIGRKINHIFGHHAVNNFAVWAFNKAIFVDTSISRQRVNQTNVWTFRCFNRADTTIVGWVHIADFKSGAITAQTTGAQSRQTTFVCNLGQRVVLIHKLRQLRRTEELSDNRGNRFGVDQILRFDIVQNFRRHSFANGSFHTEQAHAILIFHQLTDRANTTVAQVVNIINFAFTVAEFNQVFNNTQNIIFAQNAASIRGFVKRNIQSGIDFNTTDRRQVITFVIKEQTVKELICSIICRWFTRTHNTIDIKQSFFTASVFISSQSVADIWADIHAVNKQGFKLFNLGSA